jgi:enamine deaminase RidA (YjgF/YER057c/UK114 family)
LIQIKEPMARKIHSSATRKAELMPDVATHRLLLTQPEAYRRSTKDNDIGWREFAGLDGARECFFAVEPERDLSFKEQLRSVQSQYANALAAVNLTPESAIFRRIYLSDIINQQPLLRETEIGEMAGPTAVSIVGQPPAGGAKISMFAYHLESPNPVTKRRLSRHQVLVEHHGARHLWSTQLCAEATGHPADPAEQTRQIFGQLLESLASFGASLKDHCVRTWLYLKDVDVFYQGMVEARRELFEAEGLRADTHYIASTGIEGACSHRFDLVSMDAYSVLDVAQAQIGYLQSLMRLCPTNKYGVTFERGTKIAYADRAHLFISGTAAIDTDGQVVHRGDVIKQLERALANVDALLLAGDACFDDMMYLLVYLRDPSDYLAVEGYLAQRFPKLPVLILHAAVCRPEWLIEVEGQAVAPHDDASLPQF